MQYDKRADKLATGQIGSEDYFRFADDLGVLEPRQSKARQMPVYQA